MDTWAVVSTDLNVAIYKDNKFVAYEKYEYPVEGVFGLAGWIAGFTGDLEGA
jgi:hypothetical protein